MTAFVFSGGGAKGAYQAGMVKALADNGIHPSVAYGTSVGSINAFCMTRLDADGLVEHWERTNKKNTMKLNLWKTFLRRSQGIVSLRPMEKRLQRIARTIKRIPGWACYVDLSDGSVKYGDLTAPLGVSYVLASSAIPGVIEAKKINGNWCVDGGVREITPLRRAIADGHKEIYVLLASDPDKINQWNASKHRFEMEIMMRAIDDVMTQEIMQGDLKACANQATIRVIKPNKQIIDTLEFEPRKISQAIDHGYAVAKEFLNAHVQ